MGCDLQSPDVLRHRWVDDVDWIDALNGFEREFGSTELFAVDAPGRICVLGDHSDYVPYLKSTIVTFASAEQRMRALISPRKDRIVRISSSLEGCENTEFKIDDEAVERGSNWLDVLNLRGGPVPHWSNYVRGAVVYSRYVHEIDFGFDMYIHSTISAASGTSSSSALTLCGLVAAHLSNGIPWDENTLARMGGEAEWYVGTRGGAMDHATMMCAANEAMVKLEFDGGNFSVDRISVKDGGCRWYTVFTHPADKSGPMREAFNELVYVQQSVIHDFLQEIGYVHRRAEFDLQRGSFGEDENWQKIAELLPEFLDTEEFGHVRIRNRFQYVLGEERRAVRFALAVSQGDKEVIARLLEEAWIDTRDLLGTHTEKMDLVAAELRKKEGVLGVKVLGAGFGGNLLVYAEEWANLGDSAIKHTLGEGLVVIESESDC